MSFTATYSPTKSLTKTASIYLTSPSKRRRIEDVPVHTTKQLYSWTFRADAIATCSINQALTMKAEESETCDFYWLGSVPCRSVKITGIVVGISTYEKKVVYTVDDGTGVIECAHTPSTATQLVDPSSKYKYKTPVEPVENLTPLVKVGHPARFQGKVRPYHESRQIVVDELVPCSLNDELQHAKTARHLYKTVYSRKGPFVIPDPPPATPKKQRVAPPVGETPESSVSSSPIKPQSSPTKCGSSPFKPFTQPQSPIKLRHPSRLHTHDLTDNTFRIYVKHYMSHAPLVEDDEDDTDGEDDDDCASSSDADEPTTPTKRRRRNDETPRQRSFDSTNGGGATPRPWIEPIKYDLAKRVSSQIPSSSATRIPTPISSQAAGAPLKGFTLSYLRRVPELSLLASRVVEAVARRKHRTERQRAKEAKARGSTLALPSSSFSKPGPTSKSLASMSSTAAVAAIPPAKFAEKKKRLFQWAVVELLKEGGIALWDGPVRRCPLGDRARLADVSRLWKVGNNTTMAGGDGSLFGNTTTMSNLSNLSSTSTSTAIPSTLPQQLGEDDERGYLSSPSPTEESYVPLTPPYLASAVESAIRALIAYYDRIKRPYGGATKEGILSVLHKDDRWRYVGEWSVEETLVWLKDRGRVWNMGVSGGKERWDLTV